MEALVPLFTLMLRLQDLFFLECLTRDRRAAGSSLTGVTVCFVALRLNSTAMVTAVRSVYLTTLFSWASLNKAVNQYFVRILSLVTDNNPSLMIPWKGGE